MGGVALIAIFSFSKITRKLNKNSSLAPLLTKVGEMWKLMKKLIPKKKKKHLIIFYVSTTIKFGIETSV